jgi:hypothetical protein
MIPVINGKFITFQVNIHYENDSEEDVLSRFRAVIYIIYITVN